MVLDAKEEKFLFIGTLPGYLGIEVACTDLLGVKRTVDFLKQKRGLKDVNQSCTSSCISHKSSSVTSEDCSNDDEVESDVEDEVLSLDDVDIDKELCASNIVKEKTLECMYDKEGNDMVVLVPCMDAQKVKALSNSMCLHDVPMYVFTCDTNDTHVDIMGNVFAPPSYELTWYPDDLWACAPIWDVEIVLVTLVGIHVCLLVMLKRWVKKLMKTSHACVDVEEDCSVESWDNHDDMDTMDVLSWLDVSDTSHDGENADPWSFDLYDMSLDGWSSQVIHDCPCDFEGCHYACTMDARDNTFPFDRVGLFTQTPQKTGQKAKEQIAIVAFRVCYLQDVICHVRNDCLYAAGAQAESEVYASFPSKLFKRGVSLRIPFHIASLQGDL
ncbi:hypothetical protein GOP47_0008715 [Adiantum capillus-veneris]|uniref:Uncharacterized protein n=1 Tax=Adiantum capillus-veneris TaxID=13818 RepID=A0A9D4UYV3_ADICA|nr:hypothetical protein GOP47_0008715 [Adiantum capillus-veneris]